VLTGDESLRARPMRRVTGPLAAAGARFVELASPDRLPIAVDGRALDAIEHDSPHASAQIKSAILLAGLAAGSPVRVTEPWRSRDHSERMLAAMGATLRVSETPDERNQIVLAPTERLDPIDIVVPGDFSSAAFLLAASILSKDVPVRIEGVGVNPTRIGLLDVLTRMGAIVLMDRQRDAAGEPVADLVVHPASLRGTTVDAREIPSLIDEIPALAILAARAEGETRIRGAAELRVKESDRLQSLATNLRAIGVRTEEQPDGLLIDGTNAPLRGRVRTLGDHRIAMAFGVLGALPGNHIEVDDPAAASVSFPAFWSLLRDFEYRR
jgi:3-phosphoshikimate 1-carboxyvinyltransferase